jgi:hypothetical protein
VTYLRYGQVSCQRLCQLMSEWYGLTLSAGVMAHL